MKQTKPKNSIVTKRTKIITKILTAGLRSLREYDQQHGLHIISSDIFTQPPSATAIVTDRCYYHVSFELTDVEIKKIYEKSDFIPAQAIDAFRVLADKIGSNTDINDIICMDDGHEFGVTMFDTVTNHAMRLEMIVMANGPIWNLTG